MLFNSFSFLIFFPIVFIAYFVMPHRFRWAWLLAMSSFFYMFFVPKYILILGFTILVDYIAGILIENSSDPRRKKALLILSILANVGVLAFYKYFNFFSENLSGLALLIGWNYSFPLLNIILPIGLSFHTFQAMSYTIEVYRSNQKAERNFGIYALYVMFFPQLVAGPIERPQNLLHQFYEEHYFDYERVIRGLKLMAWGFFKKIVIADRLAIVVNQVFGNSSDYSGPALIVTMIFFAYQIYCDFSGYSDIARGSAQVLGFKLMLNFNRPYSAKSIAEFWKRWHISLSTWFRDYVYIPLGGNRVSTWRLYRNVFLVFLLSGFWHGANWTFIAWGALHGFMIVFSSITQALRARIAHVAALDSFPRTYSGFKVLVTFILVDLTWVFFIARDMRQALYVIFHSFDNFFSIFTIGFWSGLPAVLHISGRSLILSFCLLVFLELAQYRYGGENFEDKLSADPAWIRVGFYYILAIGILFLSVPSGQQFIYFQF